ncbi:MAG: hypothetical protein IKR68_08445, partial [Lachnospiraceae bacterium]|nr:hypothetical protein [Lachnospiraceae bacterium]
YKKEISCDAFLRGGTYLLENDVYIFFKNKKSRVVSGKIILDSSDHELKELLSKSSLIIIGGIGYSGLNPKYNAGFGLYRAAVTDIEEDKRRSILFKNIYDRVKKCAPDKKVIVLTHTPVCDWTSEQYNTNWVYVNGHTHINSIKKTRDGIVELSDNQIGYGLSKIPNSKTPKYSYTNPKWKLNSFTLDKCWYDPFEKYKNGIYVISSEEYKDFNIGRGIMNNGCNHDGELYMLKHNEMYMFLLKTAKSLCLLSGGQRKKIFPNDVQYFYNNLDLYSKKVKMVIKPYQDIMEQISDEVKRIGGSGTIHGCIVDISFYSHIYVNPFDGKITSYWAGNMMSRLPFDTIQQHLEEKEPQLLNGYKQECINKSIPLIEKYMTTDNHNAELAVVPQWVFGTEMYEPSRIMRAVQYVWEQNVIRIWNDNILSDTMETNISDHQKNIKQLE